MNTKSDKERVALAGAFPKLCRTCGNEYSNYDSYMDETSPLPAGSYSQGPKESVLSYRNCSCGSTITIKLADMRDYSEEGVKQREEFGQRLQVHLEKGLKEEEAVILVKIEMGLD